MKARGSVVRMPVNIRVGYRGVRGLSEGQCEGG